MEAGEIGLHGDRAAFRVEKGSKRDIEGVIALTPDMEVANVWAVILTEGLVD